MESPAFGRRVRLSTILLLVWAATLFLSPFPRLGIFKQLLACVCWPSACLACWWLRSYSKSARTSIVPVAITSLLAIVRALLPVQVALPIEGGPPQFSAGWILLSLCLSIGRETFSVIAIICLGRLAEELADPVDFETTDELAEKAKRHFRWLAIGWAVAAIWSTATVIALAANPLQAAELLLQIPRFLHRILFAGPGVIKIVLSWNAVLVLYELMKRWKFLEGELEAKFNTPTETNFERS